MAASSDNSPLKKKMLGPRMISADPSFLDSMSRPGTTQSLRDYFETANAADENRISNRDTLRLDIVDRKRAQSLEDDLAAIRAAGDKFMRAST